MGHLGVSGKSAPLGREDQLEMEETARVERGTQLKILGNRLEIQFG
jgi:hypothetical protein